MGIAQCYYLHTRIATTSGREEVGESREREPFTVSALLTPFRRRSKPGDVTADVRTLARSLTQLSSVQSWHGMAGTVGLCWLEEEEEVGGGGRKEMGGIHTGDFFVAYIRILYV